MIDPLYDRECGIKKGIRMKKIFKKAKFVLKKSKFPWDGCFWIDPKHLHFIIQKPKGELSKGNYSNVP